MSLEETLKQLQKEYIEDLPNKIETLKTFLAQDQFDEMINFFHQLKGSGKTYGIADISWLGEQMEHVLKKGSPKKQELVEKAAKVLEKIYQAKK